jgi:hypothetical protein
MKQVNAFSPNNPANIGQTKYNLGSNSLFVLGIIKRTLIPASWKHSTNDPSLDKTKDW